MTLKKVQKTQRRKGQEAKRTVTKIVRAHSFFNFFSPPQGQRGYKRKISFHLLSAARDCFLAVLVSLHMLRSCQVIGHALIDNRLRLALKFVAKVIGCLEDNLLRSLVVKVVGCYGA